MSNQNPVFIPGPTNIPDRLRLAMHVQTQDHRAPDFVETFAPVLEDTKKVFGTADGKIITFPASGTGGWEASITNTLSPGDKVLVARYGMFSHRWIDLCERHGLDLTIIDVAWGDGIPAGRFEEVLTADTAHEIKVVLATHNETATGVKSDIAAIRGAIDAAGHPAMLYVDGVSSIGSMDFQFDAWGVDIAVTGSQKGFMLPAGLAIVGFSARAMGATQNAGLYRTFFDIRDMENGYAANAYPYTPPVGLINGLNQACTMLLDEGLDAVFARHTRIANGVRAAVSAWGLELCATSPEVWSDTVSAIRTPKGFNATDIVTHAAESYGVAFGTGLGEVAGKVFRIGHLGSLTDVMALSGIATAEMCMTDLGLDISPGAGVAAAQEVYRAGRTSPLKKAA